MQSADDIQTEREVENTFSMGDIQEWDQVVVHQHHQQALDEGDADGGI